MSDKIWWEKTVEYRFLQMLFAENNLSISPLDGKHEKESGDAVVIQNDNWVLIEFKRDETCLSSEIQKYNQKQKGYNEAKEKLKKDGTHHFFIYGDSTSSTVLNLKSQLYWRYDPQTEAQELANAERLAKALAKVMTQDLAKAKANDLVNDLAKADTLVNDLVNVLAKADTLVGVLDKFLAEADTLVGVLAKAKADILAKAKAKADTLVGVLADAKVMTQDLADALADALAKVLAEAEAQALELAQTVNDNSENFSITNIFEKGKNGGEFVNYLDQLKSFRGEDETDGDSAVAMSIKDNKLIMIPIVNNELDLSLENKMSNNNNNKKKTKQNVIFK